MKSTLNVYRFIKKMDLTKVMRLTSILVLLITIFLIPGCGQDKNISNINQGTNKVINPELERNKRLWQESKITNYNFVITQYRGGSWTWVPVLVKIRNGQAISMETAREPTQYEKTEGYENYDTVEKIFDQIQKAYEKDYIVEIVYNKKHGYPELTKIDPLTNAHSGFAIEVSEFKVSKNNKLS